MLFNSTADIRRILPRISVNYTWDELQPYVTLAEEKYILDFISQEFLDELSDAYAVTPSTDQAAAISKLQFAVAYYTLLEAMPFLGMQIGQAGVGLGQSQTTGPVPQWKEVQVMTTLAANGETFLDKALAFLERNKTDYPTWVTSDAYTISKELFINNARELNSRLPIFESRRAYLKIRPWIQQVQEETIRPTIGADLYADLLTKLAGGSLNLDESHLVTLINKPLANIAARKAFNQLAINYDGRGFRILSINDGIIQKQAVLPEKLTGLLIDLASAGEIGISNLKQFLQTNAESWPTYKDSSAYIEDETTKPQSLPDNCGLNSFVV